MSPITNQKTMRVDVTMEDGTLLSVRVGDNKIILYVEEGGVEPPARLYVEFGKDDKRKAAEFRDAMMCAVAMLPGCEPQIQRRQK